MQVSIFDETSVYALGGLGEIGKNTYCIEEKDSIIIIDAGVKFPEEDLPGINYVIPDYTYLLRNQYKIKALIITHGHEDHIGGIPFLLQKVRIPVIYAPRLAAALIKNKLEESRFKEKVRISEVDGNTHLDVAPFEIDFVNMTHSIPDALGMRIKTSNGNIFTTGDFKIDLTPVGDDIDFAKLTRFGEEGITLMMADSTNAEVPGSSLSERAVVNSINEIFRNTPGRLIVATFASNLYRIQQIVETAVKFKRRIVIVGRSMEKTIQIGRQFGYINCPDSFIITTDFIKNYRPDELLILCTGSQGEPMAALSRIAAGLHKSLNIFPGDTVVFSSSPIPGNASSVNRTINLLTRSGANVLTNSVFTNLHASGHADKEDLKLMLKLLKPKYFMPVHGEYRMLKLHAELAHSVGVAKTNTFIMENGDTLQINNGTVKQGRRIETDSIFVDGNDTSGLSTAVLKDRQILAADGICAVVISMNSRTNLLDCTPNIINRGFVFRTSKGETKEDCELLIKNELSELLQKKTTFSEIKNLVRSTASMFIFSTTHRSPMVIPVILNRREEIIEEWKW